MDMLTRFFKNDENAQTIRTLCMTVAARANGVLRLTPKSDFWRWVMATWAAAR